MFGLYNSSLYLSLFLSLHRFVMTSGEVFCPLFYFPLPDHWFSQDLLAEEGFAVCSADSEKCVGNRTMLDDVTHLGEVDAFWLSESGKFQPC